MVQDAASIPLPLYSFSPSAIAPPTPLLLCYHLLRHDPFPISDPQGPPSVTRDTKKMKANWEGRDWDPKTAELGNLISPP